MKRTQSSTLFLVGCVAAACGRTSILDYPTGARSDASTQPNQATDGAAGDALSIDASPAGEADVDPACSGTGDVFWVRQGSVPSIVRGGAFLVQIVNVVDGLPADVRIDTPHGEWSAEFESFSTGAPLYPGLYTSPERAGFTEPGRSGLEIEGQGNDYGNIGQFEVVRFDVTPWDGGGAGEAHLESFTATFSISTFNGTLSGCVHVGD